MSIASLCPDASPTDVNDVLQSDGAVIIRNLVAAPEIDAVADDLWQDFDRTPFGEGHFVGHRTKRIGRILAKSRRTWPMLMHPTILGVMDRALGPYCSTYQVNLTQGIQIYPDEIGQVYHRDDELFPLPHATMECMVNALWAVDDFSKENGATRVLLRSHRAPEIERNPSPDQVCYAEMPRGSVVIYLGSTVHSGGWNVSSRPRTAIVMSYSLGWLRQAENQYLAAPPDIARDFPPAMQRLVGYSIHQPNLGWYEGQDPNVVMDTSQRVGHLAARDYVTPQANQALRAWAEASLADRPMRSLVEPV